MLNVLQQQNADSHEAKQSKISICTSLYPYMKYWLFFLCAWLCKICVLRAPTRPFSLMSAAAQPTCNFSWCSHFQAELEEAAMQ